MKFNIPVKSNAKLDKAVKLIEKDAGLEQMLKCANVNAVERLGYSDHGPVHSKIVANIALKISRILTSRGIVPSIVKNYGISSDDAEVVVVLAAFLHDIGMTVHRAQHDFYGIAIAQPVLEKLFQDYTEEKRAIMVSETLHAMAFHDSDIPPFTVEAGIVRVADALDMEEGRARIPFQIGKKDIHAISALAIERVDIDEGNKGEKPVQIRILMSNPAGIFQVDELLMKRVRISGLADYIHVSAKIKEMDLMEY